MTILSDRRTGSERREIYRRMVSELSQLPRQELSAILGIRPRDIPQYCRKSLDETL